MVIIIILISRYCHHEKHNHDNYQGLPGGRIPKQCVANPLDLTLHSNPPDHHYDDEDDYDDDDDDDDDNDDDDTLLLSISWNLGLKEVNCLICPLDLQIFSFSYFWVCLQLWLILMSILGESKSWSSSLTLPYSSILECIPCFNASLTLSLKKGRLNLLCIFNDTHLYSPNSYLFCSHYHQHHLLYWYRSPISQIPHPPWQTFTLIFYHHFCHRSFINHCICSTQPDLNMNVTSTVISSTKKMPAIHKEYWKRQ